MVTALGLNVSDVSMAAAVDAAVQFVAIRFVGADRDRVSAISWPITAGISEQSRATSTIYSGAENSCSRSRGVLEPHRPTR